MSTPRYTAAYYAKATDPKLRQLSGMIRRMAVDATKSLWKVLGYRLPDGTDETITSEVFSGVGFYSRPPRGAKAEAIVLYLGGPDHPVIVATRDEKTRQTAAGNLAEDESAIFNSRAMIVVKADGTIEARSIGGTAQALATKADLDAIRAALDAHTHLYLPGPGTATVPSGPGPTLPTPTGTTKLKAE